MKKIIITVGLLLNIIGCVILVFKGFPGTAISKQGNYIVTASDPNHKKEVSKAECIAKTGVFLLILGFGTQLIGVWCPE